MEVAVWVTVRVFPATVRVPVRGAPVLLVATMKVIVPFPRPGPALMSAIQATLLAASHAHDEAALTVLLPKPPSEVKVRATGEMDVVQLLAAAWVTVKVAPAIVSVPVRLVAPV